MPLDQKLHASVEKELLHAEKFYENLSKTSPWRYAAILKNARYCRESLNKALALQGNTGQWFLDIWVYLIQALPWFIPTTFVLIPNLFEAIVTFVSSTLSFFTKEPRVIETTITKPFLWIFKDTETISKIIWVPVIHAPDVRIATGIAVIIVLCGVFLLSCLLKFVFQIELKYRINLIQRTSVIR